MADYPLNCTWEEVEHSALNPNVFVTMSEYHDPDIGDITVADKSGAAIFGLLQSNPNQQIVFTDLSGRQCIMTTPPTSGVSEVRFSVLVGTTLYIYRMPDGNARVYTETVDVSSGDSGTFVVRFTVISQVISADQTYADVMAAAANGKVVLGRYGSNHYYFTGDPDDDGATFVRPFFDTNAQSLQQIILADDESVTISTRLLASNAVLYTQQTLTNQQKAQARANIGATDGASGISDTIKQELLNCFAHVAWVDDQGQNYYDALEAALYTKTVESISAVFNQGSAVIYDTDTLDTLRQYLTVTATYDDTSTAVVTAYTLSGTLVAGETCEVTVAYGGKTATINVEVSPIIFTVTADQISRKTAIISAYPYSSTASAQGGNIRCCYKEFDLAITGNQRVKITATSTKDTAQVAAHFMSESGMVKVENQQALTADTDYLDTGWQNLTFEYDLPALVNGSPISRARFNIRQGSNNPTITDDFVISQIVVEKVIS